MAGSRHRQRKTRRSDRIGAPVEPPRWDFDGFANRIFRRDSFPGQRDGEVILVFTRRHPFFLFRSILLPLMLLGLAIWLAIRFGLWERALSPLGGFGLPLVLLLCFLLALGWIAWAFVEWENDHYIVTTQRVISLRRIYRFYEARMEAEVGRVQDVTTHVPGATATLLDYADLRTTTAGVLGTIEFSRVGRPEHIKGIIFQQHRVASEARLDGEREQIREKLEKELGRR